LDEAGLNGFPFVGGDNAGNGIKGEDAFSALLIAVDSEGDALFEEKEFEAFNFLLEFLVGEGSEAFCDGLVAGPDGSLSIHEFVEKVGGGIVECGHVSPDSRCLARGALELIVRDLRMAVL
jgi:hypothetical protein